MTTPRGLTYHRDSRTSYFKDLVLARRNIDPEAEVRLKQHAMEMDALRSETRRTVTELPTGEPVEYRTNPSTTQGQGGYFAPPAWLNEFFATAPRPGRVLADLVPNFPLPDKVHSINVPLLTTGTIDQPVPDLAATPEQDIVDSSQTANVVTMAGDFDTSLQLLEQSPAGAHLDWVVYKDLLSSYGANLETGLVNGAGNNSGQILGVLNVTSINTTTYTSASPALTGMYAPIGQVAAAVGKNRKLPPEAWLMTTARWAWIGSDKDSQNRPIAPPSQEPPRRDKDDKVAAIADMLGWPVYLTDVIPTTLLGGTGNANQDTIVALRPSDLILFESDAQQVVLREPLSGTLGVRIQMRTRVAAFTARQPKGISILQGTGMIPVTGF